MTDLDSVLRAADPAGRLTPPEPGPPPFGRSVRAGSDQSPVDRLTPGRRLRPARRPPAGRGRHWLPVAAAATAVVAVIVAAGVGLGARDGGGPSGGRVPSTAPGLPTVGSGGRPPSTAPGLPTVGSGGPIPTSTPSLLPTPPDPTSYPTATAAAVATSGPDRGGALRVLRRLRAAVPARYATPTGTLPIGQGGAPQAARTVQAARFPTRPEAGMVWDVSQSVTLGRGVGGVSATVFHDVPDWGSDPCTVFGRLNWYVVGCTAMQTPAGVPVGILISVGARYAFHRYADGTAVVVSASVGGGWPGTPELTAIPFSDIELSRLATDPAFVS